MIQLENIDFGYNSRSGLFKNLTLSFDSGRVYGLLGKNGTGKTTMIKLMTGLLKPKSGSCLADGTDVFKRTPSVMNNIFIVPEEFHVPSIKMEDFVNVNAPFYPRFSYEQYYKFREEFELPVNKKLNTLSYGQKKKFMLAFGLATNVKLLFLDEPTNGLDIPSKSQLRKTIASALHEDRSIVISTHQARDLESLIDTIVIVEDGQIVFNHGYEDITGKLSFEKTITIENDKEILYKEETLGGYKVVRRAKEAHESLLDLELLFNAVVSNYKEIDGHFKN